MSTSELAAHIAEQVKSELKKTNLVHSASFPRRVKEIAISRAEARFDGIKLSEVIEEIKKL